MRVIDFHHRYRVEYINTRQEWEIRRSFRTLMSAKRFAREKQARNVFTYRVVDSKGKNNEDHS